jgi:hypothetical protein
MFHKLRWTIALPFGNRNHFTFISVAMVACGAKKEEAAAAVDSVATTVMDSTVDAVVDSVSAVVDSAAVAN